MSAIIVDNVPITEEDTMCDKIIQKTNPEIAGTMSWIYICAVPLPSNSLFIFPIFDELIFVFDNLSSI